MLAGVVAVLVGGVPARAGGLTVLTFDDLGIPAGGRVTLNTQYSAQGVTFNDVSAIDYSQAPFPAGFAHSGSVGVEQCVGVEFCSSPIAASFTSGQERVKVWVGYSFALPQPLTVRLTAFDAGHGSVGTAEVTLPANAAVTPIQFPLEVTVAEPTIRSLEVSVPGGYTNAVAVDDLEFSSAGPPPPCDAASVPTVELTQPPGDLVVQNNEFLLEGSVATGGAPIERATIIDSSQQGTRTATLYPSLVDADGGHFGPVRFNGLLTPGGNKLTVTATNCLGTGASGAVNVEWSPIPPSASFRLLGIEVTQAVQTPSGTVPLVAAAANSFKRTFARVYLTVNGTDRVTDVSGRLTASRPDGSLPGGPATIPSLNTITVNSANTLASARASLDTSLNFELPREWLTAGQLHLQLDHLEIEGARSSLPCLDCDNPGVQGLPGQPPPGPPLAWFHTVPPLRIWLVGVPYMTGSGKLVSPRQRDFDMLASWLRRAYPSADVQITQASMAALASPPTKCDDVNTALGQWAAMLPAQDPRTRFYALIPDNDKSNFVGGCSEIGGQFGSGPAGPLFPEANPWDTDGSYADAYGGHEIAHMYDRRHPGFCAGQDRGDPDYPYLNGYIGGYLGASVVEVQGLDAGDADLKLPMALNDWRGGWHDVMTYCQFQWMSDYTYRGILHNVCAADPGNCPDRALLAARARRADAGRRPSPAVAVSITGTLTVSTGKLALEPLWARAGLTPTERVSESAYAIEMLGAGGRQLARYPFKPRELSDPSSPAAAKALISEVVPFPAATRQIAIMHGNRTLASVPVSAHAPKVRLLSPNGGKALGKRVTVRWRSSDVDGNRRWYTLLYSPDGKRVIPVATELTGTSLRVDLRTLPGGSRARFEVVASDGVRTASDRSDRSFAVPVKPPRVSIATPADEAELVAGGQITFVGSGSDLQDGQLAVSQLVWVSSLQGVLGSGPSITTTLLPGTHVITLTATNRAGRSAVARVTVSVRPVPPVVVAEILP
jgi:hypothetical protein